jgi:hypothetical protein
MINLLKDFIKEEVERNLRWSAGFYGGGNIGKGRKGSIVPPPGLGSEKEQTDEKNGKKEQQDDEEREERRRRGISRNH